MSVRGETAKKWGKRAGIVAFLIFLAKGLMWLAVLVGAWWAVNR